MLVYATRDYKLNADFAQTLSEKLKARKELLREVATFFDPLRASLDTAWESVQLNGIWEFWGQEGGPLPARDAANRLVNNSARDFLAKIETRDQMESLAPRFAWTETESVVAMPLRVAVALWPSDDSRARPSIILTQAELRAAFDIGYRLEASMRTMCEREWNTSTHGAANLVTALSKERRPKLPFRTINAVNRLYKSLGDETAKNTSVFLALEPPSPWAVVKGMEKKKCAYLDWRLTQVAGSLDHADEAARDTARRELQEEMGIFITPTDFMLATELDTTSFLLDVSKFVATDDMAATGMADDDMAALSLCLAARE